VTRVFDSGWIEYFGGQGLYWVLFNLDSVCMSWNITEISWYHIEDESGLES
jgi:hypothetical protein